MIRMSPTAHVIIDGEFGPEPVSTRDDDDSLAAGCCCDDEHDHEHGLDCDPAAP